MLLFGVLVVLRLGAGCGFGDWGDRDFWLGVGEAWGVCEWVLGFVSGLMVI
ncbi:hypothetical protein N783_13210 [Pontibacillus marinus BH030004 = DSM 16465]|uniref:Uncharacterized protein n=1 Tax=Pontibacillus marinus BH030004 = DSM 16465 TaxID=1385511 RepID=A0A0A5GIR4_9BACI|nr:hypothetical protein N783_13210 [Pontibacillus marinus BH030004 = DSM 16465]